MIIQLKKPYLLFIGDAEDELTTAKTAMGIYHWRPKWCLAQLRITANAVKLDIPEMSIEAAVAAGAKTLVIGLVNFGGLINRDWIPVFISALKHGLDIANGLFDKLEDIPEIVAAAKQYNRNIYDIRYHKGHIPEATGLKRTGKRLLTVGTDMCVGKMYTSLSITKEMESRGMNVDFRATGQTGILIAESGISFDCVLAEFTAGVAELLSPANDPNHWDIVEGQGALLHPASGVALALVHGSQPDVMVLCHEPTRQHLFGVNYKVPSLEECINVYESSARLTNHNAKVIGISINTKRLENKEAYLQDTEQKYGLPCIDPLLTGVKRIVDVLEKI